MTRRDVLTLTSVLAFAPAMWAADVANMSGNWVLNSEASNWSKEKKAPMHAVIHIDHQEPKYNYDGEVHTTQEGQGTKFKFEGAIDGKEYRVKEGNHERKVVLKRVNDNTVEATITSMDGSIVEKATTSLSRDGKQLTRRIHLKTPDRETRWTEVYDKQ